MKKYYSLFFVFLLLISLFHPYKIKADTDACSTEIITGRNNTQYCMPENIYNKGTETDKAKYRLMIRSGNVGADDSQWFDDWIVSRDNLRSSAMEKDLKGVVSNYAERLKLYFKGVVNGTIHRQNSAILNYLIGSMTGNQQNTNVWQAELNSLQQSNNRNYYTQSSGNNVYNTGDTSYYSFYNPDNRTFTYNNQTYNIVNNEYNFYTYESNYYTINNEITFNYVYNIDNSVVNVIQNGSTTTSTYYFKLPDGRNSYNLTQNQIKGLKTDINISNYNVVNSSPILTGLYHFDQNLENDVFDPTSTFDISPNSITYIDSINSNFKSGLYIGARDQADPNILTFNSGYQHSVDFRLYLSDIDDITFKLKGGYNDSNDLVFRSYKKQVFSNVVQRTNTYNIVSYSMTTNQSSFSPSCGSGNTLINSKSSVVSTQPSTWSWSWSCKIPIESNSYIPMMSNISVKEGNLSEYIRPNEWNHISFRSYSTTGAASLYINGNFIRTWQSNNKDNFIAEIYGSGYAIIDELRFTNSDLYYDNTTQNTQPYKISSTPYDSNIVYILPEVSESGNLLVQSNIPVKEFQIGGVRKTLPEKGDVFVLVNDIGFMQSLQQYDGSDWVEKKGGIYNENLGYWVSYYGYSIYTNNWDYTALSELSVDDIETQKDFYTWLGAQFNKTIDAINSISINITNNVERSTNIWDFLINLIDDLLNGVNDIIDKLIDLIKFLFIPDDDFNLKIESDMDSVKTHLGILWTPFNIVGDSLNYIYSEERINSIDNRQAIISFDGLDLFNVRLIPSFEYNLFDIVSEEPFLTMHHIYYVIIDVVCIFYVIDLARKKLESIVWR